MLDEKSKIILEYIVNNAEYGKFSVIDLLELKDIFPKNISVTISSISRIIQKLASENFVTLKYYDDDVVCLSPLPYAKEIFDNEKLANIMGKRKKRAAFGFLILVCLFAFFGAFLGILVYNLL